MTDPRHALGQAAERRVQDWLEHRGLSLVARNWRGRRGELDLIMRDGPILVIIEVRARPGRPHAEIRTSVDERKCRRITNTVREYLADSGLGDSLPVRGDVVTVSGGSRFPEIQWWRNALRLRL